MKGISKFKQVGIGLLELMLSLAIIAILLVMAIRYYQSASNTQSINQAIDMVNAVKSAAKNYLTSNPGTTSIAPVSDLATKGYLPDVYINAATANPWNGAVGFGADCKSAGTVSPTLTICETQVPSVICQEIATRFTSTLSTALGESAVCNGTTVTVVVAL